MQKRQDKLVPYSLKAPSWWWDKVEECRTTQSYYADKIPPTKADFLRQAVDAYMNYHLKHVKPRVVEQRSRNEPFAFFLSTSDGRIERF